MVYFNVHAIIFVLSRTSYSLSAANPANSGAEKYLPWYKLRLCNSSISSTQMNVLSSVSVRFTHCYDLFNSFMY